jgi:hypothetical protein
MRGGVGDGSDLLLQVRVWQEPQVPSDALTMSSSMKRDLDPENEKPLMGL